MAVKSAADIVAELIAGMAVADPEIDTSIGSSLRKIFDVVAEQIAPAYAETYLISYVYSVDSKTGADLDDFCAMFGVYRLAARRAVGVVTFSRPSPAVANISVPGNTQVGTGTLPQIVFSTVAPAVLLKGTTSVSVPVQAVVAGESGNLPSDALTNLLTPLPGIASTTYQSDSMTGGVNAESDEALRTRFKRTVFRSMAGTEDMFLGVSIEDSTPEDPTDTLAVQAVVIGASKRWREQVQVEVVGADLVATSTIPVDNVKHVFTGSAFFGEDIDGGSILTDGVHYEFDPTTIPPTITDIGDNLVEGRVYDLDFEYVPMASRNEPADNITNRVDIWVSGVSPQQATETTYYRPQIFTGTAGPFCVDDFVRLSEDGLDPPDEDNAFLQLAWGPIVDFPEALAIGGDTYLRDTDYWVVHQNTGYGYSPTSKFGLEFLESNQPPLNAQILLVEGQSYFYNRLPADVQARVEKWKLVTTDVKVHAAKQVRLALNFAIMYSSAYDRGTVQGELDRALANWMSSLGFRTVVQVSDILAVAHAVPGVDNVRFLNSLEESVPDVSNTWGIQQVTADGTHLGHFSSGSSPARARDIVLSENEVPVLYDVRYVTKAQNTWGEPDA
jgi:hypothetical protein